MLPLEFYKLDHPKLPEIHSFLSIFRKVDRNQPTKYLICRQFLAWLALAPRAPTISASVQVSMTCTIVPLSAHLRLLN